MAGVLKVDENGIGEQGAEIESEVEIGEERRLRIGLFLVGFVELVGAEGGERRLVAAIA